MEQHKKAPAAEAVERYRQQMLEQYRQQTHSPTAEKSADNWLEERFPPPDIQRDRIALTTVAQAVNESIATEDMPLPEPPDPVNEVPEPSSALPESPFVGYLRVFTFTGSEAEPIPGARITVTRSGDGERTVYASLQTDRDGLTPVAPLPSVDPALTMRPGSTLPYVAYDILVSREGFVNSLYEQVPVYGNNYVTQPVPLFPLLPGEDPDTVRRFISGGPANL